MNKDMFKIADIKYDAENDISIQLVKLLEGMRFSVTIKNTNSKQMDSNIDSRIVETLSHDYTVTSSKNGLSVDADGVKIGELDAVFSDSNDNDYYLEIEKSNKKTLWFDYIKLLTKLASDANCAGIVMCPTNYAHSVGVWDLNKEAVIYKNHLKRVFNNYSLDRITVIGYTQYVFIDDNWVAFDTNVVKRLKENNQLFTS